MNLNPERFHFGTKSETLVRLQSKVTCSTILPLYYFTASEWRQSQLEILKQISRLEHGGSVIVRSSAQSEDNAQDTMAGAFISCLDVAADNPEVLASAIDKVIASFDCHSHHDNQVLVQPMLQSIQMSGVVMTHDLQLGSPYYTVNYDDESGKTDTVTGGIGAQKTVLVYRDANLSLIRSNRLRSVIEASQELEHLCGSVPLDIEFAVDTQDQVYVLQVRRISLCKSWHPVTERRVARQLEHVRHYLAQRLSPHHSLYGQSSILGSMPDWNPAEIIGANPRLLATSLYRFLVTDHVWRESRAYMGYHNPRHCPLMLSIGNHPFIDVRASFNSFLPANISKTVAEKLVNAWVKRLAQNSVLHDKVEFEVVSTCLDFCFDEDFSKRYSGLLTSNELTEYKNSLSVLTEKIIADESDSGLSASLDRIAKRASLQSDNELAPCLYAVQELLLDCREQGTFNFAMIARHAFIAESMLRSACRRGAISTSRVKQWKQSLRTVLTDLTQQYNAVCLGKQSRESFLARFGHLRPGTYDITSLRYDERADLFDENVRLLADDAKSFAWRHDELESLQQLIEQQGWALSASQLLDYAQKAIAGREYAKFVFTRDLSDALVCLDLWGAENGLSREDLSFLPLERLLSLTVQPMLDDTDRVLLEEVQSFKSNYENASLLKLGHLITSSDELFVVPIHRAMANFVTDNIVEAQVTVLKPDSHVSESLVGKIVCIENADPGYDWIFTRGIAGLITQFGGTNSHMAIRCAEFAIPAAIGCGEQLFQRLLSGRYVALNCRDKVVTLV